MSKFVTEDMIKEARKVDLLTYLQNYEPQELVHLSGNTYSTKTHDSLIISNGLWHRFSTDEGGKNAIDYLMKVEGYSFPDAVRKILENENILPLKGNNQTYTNENKSNFESKTNKEKEIYLPKKATTNKQVIDYLMNRGIDESIINYCIINNLIYQEEKTNNVVFLGYDDNKNIKYAGCRATENKRIFKEAKGSSKEYSFRIVNDEMPILHLFESSIDLLSYATLLKLRGYDWTKQSMIALSGVYQTQKNIEQSKVPIAIENYLKKNNNIEEIILHFDNDIAGRNATKALLFLLGKDYKVRDFPAPIGKDINDYLCFSLGLKNRDEIEKYKQISREENAR